MDLPNTYTDINETGCCAIPAIDHWDEQEVVFENKKFIRMHTKSLFYVPLNMAKVMTKLQETAENADATMLPEQAMILSRELSPWKAEQLYAVDRLLDGADNVELNGTYLTKVFEGPFKNAGKWHKELLEFAKNRGRKVEKTYFFYTTCPKCAKHYGKNYVIGFVDVS